MKNIYEGLILNSGASTSMISKLIIDIKYDLPKDYINFLMHSDGANGVIGKSFIYLWSIKEIKSLNKSYKVKEFAPGILLIGSDGGGNGFGIDTRNIASSKYIEVPFIGMSLDELSPCGNSFRDFLMYVRDKWM